MTTRILAAALAVCLTAIGALAQTAPATRIRGTIATIDGQLMIVNSRDGQKSEIKLNDPLTVSTVKKVDLAAVGSGSYVGIATRTGSDGSMQALEVLVFPEAMRGASEGHFAWDLEPGSMMTNGTVSGAVEAASGRELTVNFKGGSKTVQVPPNTPVVTLAPAERADLKPGAPVFFSATRTADGQLATSRVTVGKDGVAPPM